MGDLVNPTLPPPPARPGPVATTPSPAYGVEQPVSAPEIVLLPPPPGLGLAACLDSTDSVYRLVPTLPDDALASLADVVEKWATTDVARDGSALPVGELRLVVATVAANSFAPGGVLIRGGVSAVPGLGPYPVIDASTRDPVAVLTAYERNYAEWEARAKQAQSEAEKLAEAVGEATLPRAPLSDVAGCVSTAAQLIPADAGRRVLLVVSDLDHNTRAQWAGSLAGYKVVVVHACPDVRTCTQQQDWFVEELDRRGATSVTFYRPELVWEAIEEAARQ
jgi:hypothetical protein